MAHEDDEVVRVTLRLPPEAGVALDRVQQLAGKESLEETVEALLKLHGITIVNGVCRVPKSWPPSGNRGW